MKQILTVLIALLLLGLLACEGPQGPEGKEGPAGANAGFVYFEGFKDSLRCASCHNPGIDTTSTSFHVAGKREQWKESLHGSGTAWEENRTACAECHTTEGFIKKTSGQSVPDIPDPTPPGCFACHSPHSQGDFSLRTTAPVTLPSSITGVAAATFDKGNGNLCVACHRPRELAAAQRPDPTKTDTMKITTARWYGHYGVQGQVLIGAGAFQFADAAAYPSTAAHSSGDIATKGCATCHMVDYTPANAYGGAIGGHTMHMRYNTAQLTQGCKSCHSTITALDHNGKQTQVVALMDSLKSLLVGRGWINASDAIQIPTTGDRTLKIFPASRSGALFNYMMLLHDGSKGVHNPAYTIAMLNASIAELNKP